jgi:hypothetical protein
MQYYNTTLIYLVNNKTYKTVKCVAINKYNSLVPSSINFQYIAFRCYILYYNSYNNMYNRVRNVIIRLIVVTINLVIISLNFFQISYEQTREIESSN